MTTSPAPSPPIQLRVRQLCKQFGATTALAPTDLDIACHEFVTLLGPSGCGKSSLLRLLAGITPASGGSIELAGVRIDGLPPEQRDIAMVFQSYALFPHLSVRQNLVFGLRMKRVDQAEQRRRIDHATAICKLDALLARMPRQLSGGQQQRVALARAIVMRPALMLFDEPLSNLDAKLRDQLRDELVQLHRSNGSTSLYVTHDQAEAMAMSDRILVMNAGTVLESGSPLALYRAPRHAFTARFLGQTNLLTLAVQDHQAQLPWGQGVAVDGVRGRAQVSVSLRPEDLQISATGRGDHSSGRSSEGHDSRPARITAVSFAGAQVHYTVQVGDTALRVSRSGSAELLAVGAAVVLWLATPGPLQALAP